VTGRTNDTLTNHGTDLSLEAILSRLDFAYSDRRPIYIIEQELSVLRQGNLSVLDFYKTDSADKQNYHDIRGEPNPPSGHQPNKLMRVNNLQEDHFLEEKTYRKSLRSFLK